MTRKIITIALVLAAFLYSPRTYPEAMTPHQLTVDERLSDFYQLINQIKNGYGPKEYKKEKFGIDVDELAKEYWDKMKSAKDNGEFYSLIIQFVGEFKDGHFRANIPTTYSAYLGFSVNLVQDKVLIEDVYRDVLSKEEFPFERGDELISIDERPAGELMEEFLPYIHTANALNAKASAAYWLVYRPGRRLPVPSGKAAVAIKPRRLESIKHVTLEWKHAGVSFDENISSTAKAMTAMISPLNNYNFDLFNLSIADLISDYRMNIESSYHCNPITRIAIPKDATILIEKPFTAYHYPTSKGNIGYIRIHDYHPKDEDKDGKRDYEKWFENYRWTLDRMEKETVGLIIDQDHNCGGSVSFLENIVSLFMNGEFTPLTFQFRASKQQILECRAWLDEFANPYYMDHDDCAEVCKIIEDSFSKGIYLTPKTTFHGNRKLNGSNVYTKPVIILIDYFAGSGGDAFPAMMQGFGRAKLLGSTTSGLGGHVTEMPPLFYSQIKSDMTRSLFFRPDGIPVENNGAEPDIPYEITVNDFMNGYTDYQRFYTEELLKIIE